jgi:hypothetical protein
MASSLIYLIIIGMWVAYFLPRWISSHDEVSGRSAERYKSAMKLVAENDRPSNVRVVTDPVKKKNAVTHRRLIFSILGGLFLASLGVVAVGVITWAILFIPLSGLAIYCVNVRRQVLAAQLRARRLKAFKQIATAELAAEPAARISLARERRINNEKWIPLAERLDSAGVVVIPREHRSWEPVQVPKPTYVSAPKAITPNRIIDLTTPGAWLEEQEKVQNALLPSREEIFDQELAEQAAIRFDDVGETKAVNN